jgi:coenzyme F420-reducing hydrogenase gamma subunit
VQDTDITDGNAIPHKVEVDLNMLYALVLNEVGKEIDSVDVVIVEGALRQRDVELLK